MRTIRRTTRFKKDFKRDARGVHGLSLEADLVAVISRLATDEALPVRYRDHALMGEWRDHRDCHVHPDLVRIYRKPDDIHLDLVRLGSHSELSF